MAKAYWFDNNQAMRLRRGMGDSAYLPRGSKIQWRGLVWGLPGMDSFLALGLYPGGLDQLETLLRNQGFGLESDAIDYKIDHFDWGWTFKIIVTVTTPIDYSSADHAGWVIKGDVESIYGAVNQPELQVLNRVTIDPKTGQPGYVGAPTNIKPPPDAGACSQKSGLDWLACQFDLDTTAQKLGLGVGAGVTLVAIGLAVVAVIILKK